MIISISGRIGSGKDTLGKIFQALIDKPTCFDKLDVITEEDIDYAVWDQPSFEIKKFADKLKDMVCILLNCTREQLEDREFKERELGEEWWKYRIIRKGYSNFYVSTEKEALEYIANHANSRYVLVKLTPRKILQLLGTEAGREIIHPNIWVNSLMSQYKPKGGFSMTNTKMGVRFYHEDGSHTNTGSIPAPEFDKDTIVFPNWVITDTRFPNEFEAVKSRGGICIKIKRDKPCHVCGTTKYERRGKTCEKISCPSDQPLHESETALNKQTFDYEICNNGSIKELVEIAKKFLKDFKIKK